MFTGWGCPTDSALVPVPAVLLPHPGDLEEEKERPRKHHDQRDGQRGRRFCAQNLKPPLPSKPEQSSPLKIWTVLSPRNLNSPLPSKPELSSPLFSTRLLFSDGRESLRWWFERFYETQWATSQTLKRYCGEEEFRQEGWSKVVLLQWTSTVPTSKPGTLMTKAETVIAGKLDDPLGTN